MNIVYLEGKLADESDVSDAIGEMSRLLDLFVGDFGALVNSLLEFTASTFTGLMPLAYNPPASAPPEVPTMASIGMCSSSNAFSTPMCAAPRAPPPLKTSPTLCLGFTVESPAA